MKKSIYILILSTLAIFTMSCDAESIAALTEAASAFLETTPGCMNANNLKYNPEANEHVQDSCAVLSYGCMDSGALNFNEPCMTVDHTACTNTCQGISADQCCTASTAGCTDPNYANYNEDANSDDGSCSGTIAYGCMTISACNYNPNATADCSKVTGGTNTNCCSTGSTTTTECVQDLDNDGYQDSGSTSQILVVNNCGCGTLGFGWKDMSETNGAVIYGCTDPSCPEYTDQCNSTEGCANRDDGNCCLGFSALDSLYMFGDDYADCASDPTLCVETEVFSLLGGYFADFSGCEDQMMGPDDFHDELYVFLGWNGEYYEEFLSIHQVDGYRAPPIYLPAYDSPADCGSYAAGSNWYCGNQIADAEAYRPCQEEYFEGPCEQRDECWWEGPECRWNTSQWVGDACFDDANMSGPSACTSDPGCQWNQQWGDCYFDCWGLDETTCNDPALGEECRWKVPDSNDGFCSAPANNWNQCNAQGASGGTCSDPNYTIKQACENAGTCSDTTYTTEQACYSGGTCSIAGFESQQACENAGTCSDTTYTSQQACDNAGSCYGITGDINADGIVDYNDWAAVPSITSDQACHNNCGYCTDPSFTNNQACEQSGGAWYYCEWTWANNYWQWGYWQWAWWESAYNWWYEGESTCNGWDEWNNNTNQWEFVCECYAESEAECTTNGYNWQTHATAQCEYKPYDDGCGQLDNPQVCNSAATTNNCVWDFQGGYCFKEQGADCWTLNSEQQCGSNTDCSWWIPPGYNPNNVPTEFQNVTVPGVCNFYDWCHDYYCYDGNCDEQGCNDDDYCRWEDIPGQPKNCIEDMQAQYCECYVEWSQSSCAQAGLNWDNMHNECMQGIDENTCYNIDDLMLGPADGNIDCGAYVEDNIDQYTEWSDTEGVCEVIFEDALDGVWSIDGNTICIEKIGVFEEEACNIFDFEECQCNLHRCNWSPQPTPSDPDAGVCGEGSHDPGQGGGGRVQGVEHYKIKTVSPVFQDEMINLFGNSPDCMSFSLQNNGDVHITSTKPDGQSCIIVLKPEGSDGT